jgi:hypothetical protein
VCLPLPLARASSMEPSQSQVRGPRILTKQRQYRDSCQGALSGCATFSISSPDAGFTSRMKPSSTTTPCTMDKELLLETCANRAQTGPLAMRAVYEGPAGQDPAELFELCEPPCDAQDGFVEEVKRTGVFKQRSLVHRDGDWHRSVDIWVRARAHMRACVLFCVIVVTCKTFQCLHVHAGCRAFHIRRRCWWRYVCVCVN